MPKFGCGIRDKEKCQRHFGVEKLGGGLVRSSLFCFKGKYHVEVRYWRQELEGSSGLEKQESEWTWATGFGSQIK